MSTNAQNWTYIPALPQLGLVAHLHVELLPHPIVTKMRSGFPFFRAEGYQQNFVQNHPRERHVMVHDLPKLKRLKEAFPKLWREQPLRYVPEENKRSKLLPPPTLD